MDNKLSELSKPVAWTWHAYGLQHATTEEDERDELIADGVENSPLYSQEYVSALLAELEAKDKRIAELERANQSQDDHINQQQDRIELLEKKNSDLGKAMGAAEKRLAESRETTLLVRDEWQKDKERADAAEKQLATPKPPEKCPTCNRRYTLESYAHGECAICRDPFDADDALRAMGFTVEGDE